MLGIQAMSIRPRGRAWELLYLLTLRDLKVRYQDTALGFLWSLLKPLTLAAVYYIVFRYLVNLNIDDYHLVLIAALFPWIWFQSSVLLATPAFAANGPLLKKVPFPRFVLPFATIINSGVHFALSLPIFVLRGSSASPSWPVSSSSCLWACSSLSPRSTSTFAILNTLWKSR